ncbi:MAG TPA: hypothetical protein VHB20_14600 [Verrucomicrobiae bacterium]|jgi:hypothetical protein|nr:hypothetical protein [Verrucomicrobiae bacterium]
MKAAPFQPLTREEHANMLNCAMLWTMKRADCLLAKRGRWTQRDEVELNEIYLRRLQIDRDIERFNDQAA